MLIPRLNPPFPPTPLHLLPSAYLPRYIAPITIMEETAPLSAKPTLPTKYATTRAQRDASADTRNTGLDEFLSFILYWWQTLSYVRAGEMA